jgi:polyisoprenoid-binding protein YceI
MHAFSRGRAVTAVLVTMLIESAAAGAQRAVEFDKSSKVVIEGTSNVHKWTCATSDFEVTVDAPQSPPAELGKTLKSLVVTIPVKSIDCNHGDMNRNLQKAMHADKHPNISYRMTSYEAVSRAGSYEAQMDGTLTINGTDRPSHVHATITPDGAGGASVVGSAPVKTTEFGVKTVSALLGTIRTGADVTITFRLTGKPR